jgi:hypothetical protein
MAALLAAPEFHPAEVVFTDVAIESFLQHHALSDGYFGNGCCHSTQWVSPFQISDFVRGLSQ